MSATAAPPEATAEPVALRACWNALPALLATSLPVTVALAVVAGLALGGAPGIAAPAGTLLIGPAWLVLAGTADGALAGRAPRLRALPALGWAAVPRGVALATPPAAAALLVLANLAVLGMGAGRVFMVPLAANLAALGATLLVAPFAFSVEAHRRVGPGAAWRVGAGVAATSPRIVIGGLAAVVLIAAAVRIVGPGIVLLVPPPMALAASAATAAVLDPMVPEASPR
jgi:hypothetical protein